MGYSKKREKKPGGNSPKADQPTKQTRMDNRCNNCGSDGHKQKDCKEPVPDVWLHWSKRPCELSNHRNSNHTNGVCKDNPKNKDLNGGQSNSNNNGKSQKGDNNNGQVRLGAPTPSTVQRVTGVPPAQDVTAGRVANSSVGQVGERQTQAQAGPNINPIGRVDGRMPLGRFSADRLSADLPGKQVVLSGNARLRINQGVIR